MSTRKDTARDGVAPSGDTGQPVPPKTAGSDLVEVIYVGQLPAIRFPTRPDLGLFTRGASTPQTSEDARWLVGTRKGFRIVKSK